MDFPRPIRFLVISPLRWAGFRVPLGIGVFAKAKIPAPCAWQASLPIFEWGMRTPTYRVCRSGLHLQKSHLLYCYKLTSPRMAIYRRRRYAQSANFAFGEGRLFLNIFGLVSLIPFQSGIGVFAKEKIPALCAWQASLPIFGWGMRTPRTLCAVMRILYYVIKKEKTPLRVSSLFWQRNRDSNPNIQSQSLLCYRYTIPLSLFSLISIAQRFSFVKGVLKIYFAFFLIFMKQFNKSEALFPYFLLLRPRFPRNIPRFWRNPWLRQ